VDILFFGKLGDTIGRELRIEPPPAGCTVGELRGLLASRFPHAAADLARSSLRACVDDAIVGDDFLLTPDGRVEFLPPLSGG